MVLPNKKNGCGFYTEITHSPVQKPSGSWFQCIPTPVWNTFHPSFRWFPMHFILVSNAFLRGFQCIPSWFPMHSILVSNAFHPGFQCIPSWFPMHSFLVSNAFHPGFQCIPSWFSMRSILVSNPMHSTLHSILVSNAFHPAFLPGMHSILIILQCI